MSFNQKDVDTNGFSCFTIPYSANSIADSVKKLGITGTTKDSVYQERNEMIPATRFPLGTLKVAYYRIKDLLSNTKYGAEWQLDNDMAKLQIVKVLPGEIHSLKQDSLSKKISIFFIAHAEAGFYTFESIYNGKVKSRVELQSGRAVFLNPELENSDFRIGKKKKGSSQMLILKVEFIKKEKKTRILNE